MGRGGEERLTAALRRRAGPAERGGMSADSRAAGGQRPRGSPGPPGGRVGGVSPVMGSARRFPHPRNFHFPAGRGGGKSTGLP